MILPTDGDWYLERYECLRDDETLTDSVIEYSPSVTAILDLLEM